METISAGLVTLTYTTSQRGMYTDFNYSLNWNLESAYHDTLYIIKDSSTYINVRVSGDASVTIHSGNPSATAVSDFKGVIRSGKFSVLRDFYTNKAQITFDISYIFSVACVPANKVDYTALGGPCHEEEDGETVYTAVIHSNSVSRTVNISTTTRYGTGAKITSVSDFTDETSPIINYTYDKGTNVSSATLAVGISFTGAKMDIPYRNVPTIDGSYTFVFTESDLTTLWTLLNKGNTATVRIYLRKTEVVSGETMHIEDYVSKSFNFVNYTPVIHPTIYDTNQTTIALTGNASHLIRYMSDVHYEMDVELRKGAKDVIGCYIQNGGVIEEGLLSGNFDNPTSNIFYFSATDDRGYTGKSSYSLDMFFGEFINYIKLTTGLKCTPINATGEVEVTVSGKYFNANFGVAQNQLSIEYAVYKNGEEPTWVSLGAVTPQMTDNTTYSYVFTVRDLDYTKQYNVSIRVNDLLMNAEASVSVVATPVFYWNGDNFYFNVPVTFNGDIIINGQSLLEILRNGGLIT